jgi:hypothetical protein
MGENFINKIPADQFIISHLALKNPDEILFITQSALYLSNWKSYLFKDGIKDFNVKTIIPFEKITKYTDYSDPWGSMKTYQSFQIETFDGDFNFDTFLLPEEAEFHFDPFHFMLNFATAFEAYENEKILPEVILYNYSLKENL